MIAQHAYCEIVLQFLGQASRAVSTGKLNASRRLHLQPINQVVFLGSLGVFRPWEILSLDGFRA